MTREEILSMEPGRELDAIIAEKVMGWEVLNTRYKVKGYIAYLADFRPSTDISAAWVVFEHLVQEYPDAHITHPWLVSLDYDPTREEVWGVQAEGETAPLAICRAALLTVIEQ